MSGNWEDGEGGGKKGEEWLGLAKRWEKRGATLPVAHITYPYPIIFVSGQLNRKYHSDHYVMHLHPTKHTIQLQRQVITHFLLCEFPERRLHAPSCATNLPLFKLCERWDGNHPNFD